MYYVLLNLDLYIHSGRQIELHQRIDSLVGRVDDIHQSQVRTDLELVARSLVDVRRAQQVEALLARGQRHRSAHHRAGALRRIHDLERRLVDQPVVERLETDTDALALHFLPFTPLLDDFGYNTCAHGLAALADGKAQALLHRDRRD